MVSQEAMAGSVPCGSGSGSVSNSMVQRSGVSVPSGWFWNNALRNQGVAGVPKERQGYRSKTELAYDFPQ